MVKWDTIILDSPGSKEEAIQHALITRKGGYHSRIVKRKNNLGFRFVRKRNGRVVKEKAEFEWVVYRRWDPKYYPRDCLPKNMVGRKAS
jgi:hypothetical protein